LSQIDGHTKSRYPRRYWIPVARHSEAFSLCNQMESDVSDGDEGEELIW